MIIRLSAFVVQASGIDCFRHMQASRQLAVRVAAKLAQKAEYIWMDGAEGQEGKVGCISQHSFPARGYSSCASHQELCLLAVAH